MVLSRISRPASEPLFTVSQQKLPSRAAPVEVTPQAPSSMKMPAVRREEDDSGLQAGAATEVRSIMQHGGNTESPGGQAAWLGVSPPTRSTGAANPLVQDFNWRSNAYRCSHSNLQALREIDARGSVSFLRCSSQVGDCRLLVDSPEYGLLSGADEGSAAAPNSADDTTTTVCYVPSRHSCQVTSSSAASGQPHLRVGTPLSCQMGFFVR